MIYRPAFCPETAGENDLGTISGSCTVTLINLHGTSYRNVETEYRKILGTAKSESLNNHQTLKNQILNDNYLHMNRSGTVRNHEEHSGTIRNHVDHSRTIRKHEEHSGTVRNHQEY